MNPLLLTDSYKLGHANQYPKGTQFVYSNFTPRSVKHALNTIFKNTSDHRIVFFGLQAVLKEMNDLWNNHFFKQNKNQVIDEFMQTIVPYMPANDLPAMRERIEALHDYGKLPIKVNALPEGTLVEAKTPVLTVINTEPQFYWITNYLETWLSANLWKVMTAATTARVYRNIINRYAQQTGVSQSHKEFLNWQCHDFSMRGMSGIYDARLTGLGHLTSFTGSDTLIAAQYAKETYGDKLPNDYLYAGSVPATEHSVMCLGSTFTNDNENGEFNLFKRLITEVYPEGIVSIVSDTWDYWKVVTEYTKELKDIIMSRNGKVVIRPDSGNPVHIIAGYKVFRTFQNDKTTAPSHINQTKENETQSQWSSIYKEWQANPNGDDKCVIDMNGTYYEVKDTGDLWKLPKHVVDGSIETLWHIFGGTHSVVQGQGNDGLEHTYRTLDEHIGLIYGDSITTERCEEILKRLADKGFSSVNVVFGVGSYTYNLVSRDTLGFAMKATYGVIDGQGFNVMKDPKTDTDKVKKSATGLLQIIDGKLIEQYQLQESENETPLTYNQGELETVFVNGEFMRITNLEAVRQRLANS